MNVSAIPLRLFNIVHLDLLEMAELAENRDARRAMFSPLRSNVFTSTTCRLHLPPPLSLENRKPHVSKTAAVGAERDGKSPALSLPGLKKTVDRFYSSLWLCVITRRGKNGGKDERLIIKMSNSPPN